jgi:[ribosomal protein S18]-alanine N-acetyltransferase
VSAVLREPARAEPAPMTLADVDAVLALEHVVYPFPWTRGNFVDSLAAGHLAWTLRDDRGAVQGYCVAMAGVDEMHLLNLTIAPPRWGRGLARGLLDALAARCRAERRTVLWLEVRESNQRARAVYTRYGFETVGLRRAYYPAAAGREDAIVMRKPLAANDGAAHALD